MVVQLFSTVFIFFFSVSAVREDAPTSTPPRESASRFRLVCPETPNPFQARAAKNHARRCSAGWRSFGGDHITFSCSECLVPDIKCLFERLPENKAICWKGVPSKNIVIISHSSKLPEVIIDKAKALLEQFTSDELFLLDQFNQAEQFENHRRIYEQDSILLKIKACQANINRMKSILSPPGDIASIDGIVYLQHKEPVDAVHVCIKRQGLSPMASLCEIWTNGKSFMFFYTVDWQVLKNPFVEDIY